MTARKLAALSFKLPAVDSDPQALTAKPGPPSATCRHILTLLGVILTQVAGPTSKLVAQSANEVVTGRVVDMNQQPVVDASVSITGEVSQSIRVAHTDKNGEFRALFADLENTYSIFVQKIGFTPALKRIARPGSSNVLVANVVLGASILPLAPLVVRVPKAGGSDRRERPSIGGYSADEMKNLALLPDASDLNAINQLVPGIVASGDSGYSVMGAPVDQNNSVLDGMKFEGTTLPPDASCSIQLSTSSSDPGRGGFAGGQTSISSCRGRDVVLSTIRTGLADPLLGWMDPASAIPSSRLGTASGFVSGPLRSGVAHYHLSFSWKNSSRPVTSLLTLRDTILGQLGLGRDTLNAFTAALASLAIPVRIASLPTTQSNTAGSAALNIDWAVGASSSLALSLIGSIQRTDGSGLDEISVSTVASRGLRTMWRAGLTGTKYFGSVLDALATVVTLGHATTTPYLDLPGAVVQTTATPLRFGGGADSTSSAHTEWNTQNTLSWYLKQGKHEIIFGQQLALDWDHAAGTGASGGFFDYQSLTDLALDHPSAYTRSFGPADRSTQYVTGSAWVSDVWVPSRPISIQGGLRVDGVHFGSIPQFNPGVDSLFHRRTDLVPSDLALSPRIGFAWLIKQHPDEHRKDPVTGEIRTLHYADFTALGEPRANLGSGITFYANVGSYHGSISPSRVAALFDHTGLAGSRTTLSCVGAATPLPDWSVTGGASFSQCADGATGSGLGTVQPAVALLAPDFRAPVDWKINLGLTGLFCCHGGTGTIALILKHGVHYPSAIDLNRQPIAQFSLGDELGRPVFVPAAAIVTSSGLASPVGGRIAPQYGSVMEEVADLHDDAAQLNVGVGFPRIFRNRLSMRVDYSLNVERGEQRGFNGTTAGDPLSIQTVTGAQPRHQIFVTFTGVQFGWVSLLARLGVYSGTGYTPIVNQDINGDGLVNDRAFIFDPARVADTAFATQLRRLIADAPSSARDCLALQLGAISRANSCRGPWEGRFDASVSVAPPPGSSLGTRLRLTATLLNAGALLVRVLGANSALVQTLPPDPRFLNVVGFDPAGPRFLYQVNPAFGQPIGTGVGGSRLPPFQLQVGLEYKLGMLPANPLMTRMGFASNHKAPYTAAELTAHFRGYAVSPIDSLFVIADSLALSQDQVRRLRAVADEYVHAADSVVSVVVGVLLARGPRLIDADLSRQLSILSAALAPRRSDARDLALDILTAEQRLKLASMQTRVIHRSDRP